MDWHKDLTLADLLETLENTQLCSVVRLNGKLVFKPQV